MNERERLEWEESIARARADEERRQAVAASVTRERRRWLNVYLTWCRIGAMRAVVLRREQVRALDVIDLAELRDSFGATAEMIDVVVRLAADTTDECDVRLDFESRTVTVVARQ